MVFISRVIVFAGLLANAVAIVLGIYTAEQPINELMYEKLNK
jgi:hypothetical protein